jgi:hypothetical protein
VFDPGDVDLPQILRGTTYEAVIRIFRDEALQEPLDLTPYQVKITTDGGLFEWVEGREITVAPGEIRIFVADTETAAISPSRGQALEERYALWLIEKEGFQRKLIPLRGKVPVEDP